MNFISHKKTKIFLLIVIVFLFIYFTPTGLLADSGANFKFKIINSCGDSVVNYGEQCDGERLAGQTCYNLGFRGGGILTCSANCLLNTSQCYSQGGVSGGSNYDNPVTRVIFEGRSYPQSTVVLLKDAQLATSTIVGSDATFQITLSDLAGGNYLFSIYSEGASGERSSTLTFTANVTPGAVNKVDNIYIAPTLMADKSMAKRGDNLVLAGQAIPNSEIIPSFGLEGKNYSKIITNPNGNYSFQFNTTDLEYGPYLIKVKSILEGVSSSESLGVGFLVGDKNVVKGKETEILRQDLNGDGRVDIVDFSILAYWYKRSTPPALADFNADGVINILDFSVLAYYWTG